MHQQFDKDRLEVLVRAKSSGVQGILLCADTLDTAEENLKFIRFNKHILSSAEDDIGGWFGWPNLIMKPKGKYLGLTSKSNIESEMRVVDLYRRDGNKIAENWVIIDHLHFLKLLGIDLLEKNRELSRV